MTVLSGNLLVKCNSVTVDDLIASSNVTVKPASGECSLKLKLSSKTLYMSEGLREPTSNLFLWYP